MQIRSCRSHSVRNERDCDRRTSAIPCGKVNIYAGEDTKRSNLFKVHRLALMKARATNGCDGLLRASYRSIVVGSKLCAAGRLRNNEEKESDMWNTWCDYNDAFRFSDVCWYWYYAYHDEKYRSEVLNCDDRVTESHSMQFCHYIQFE